MVHCKPIDGQNGVRCVFYFFYSTVLTKRVWVPGFTGKGFNGKEKFGLKPKDTFVLSQDQFINQDWWLGEWSRGFGL